MKKPLIAVIVVLFFATLACSVLSGPEVSDAPDDQSASNVFFRDDFSSPNSGWDRNDWDSGLTDYQDGVYRMLVKIPDYDIWANPGQYFEGDVRVEVDATKIGGPDDNDFGLICRYSGSPDSPSYYYFLISSDGFAVIGKVDQGESAYISSDQMQPNGAINQGATTNHLRADCIGSNLTLFVNGQQVTNVSDSSFSGGDVGFMVGTFGEPNVDITFDNLVVSKP